MSDEPESDQHSNNDSDDHMNSAAEKVAEGKITRIQRAITLVRNHLVIIFFFVIPLQNWFRQQYHVVVHHADYLAVES